MDRKEWKFDLDGTEHVVVLDWTYYSGERRVSLDGRIVDESAQPMRWKSEQAFEVDGRTAVVRTKPRKKISPYFLVSLEVDGREIDSDSKLAQWEKAA